MIIENILPVYLYGRFNEIVVFYNQVKHDSRSKFEPNPFIRWADLFNTPSLAG